MRIRFWVTLSVAFLVPIATVRAATASYRNLVLSDDPIVYYEFDETSGTTAANSATTGATYTGTFNTTGGSITVNQASFAQGGTAYNFGGGFIGAASALTNSLTEWTVEAWVNYDSAKTSQSHIVSNDQGGWNNDVLMGIGVEQGTEGVPTGNVGLIQQGSPGTTRDFVGTPLVANEWHHVVVTGSTIGGALKLYVDGVLVNSDTDIVNGVTFNGADGIGTANLTIGAARPLPEDLGYRPYDGLLDEVAIYNTVLDATTIEEHFQVGSNSGQTVFRISSFSAVGGGIWEVTLEGEPGTTYEFRSSAVLDFNPGTLVENLTQGDPGDPGTIGGVNDANVTTDGSGNATIRMTLAGSANFVRAQTPPP